MTSSRVLVPLTMFLTAFAESGVMSVWHVSPTILSPGGSCALASAANGGMDSPGAQSKYINGTPKMYCAVSDSLYQGGKGCGKCYQLTGQAGTRTVQVVSRMENSERLFDCQLDSFQAITGQVTSVFPITWEEVDCETNSGGATMHVFGAEVDTAAEDLWFVSVLFFNVERGVHDVKMTVGNRAAPVDMKRHGSRWDAENMGGVMKPIHFVVTMGDGEQVTYDASNDPEFAKVKVAPSPCSGEPCAQGMCRSKWNSCGSSADFCNDDSLWTPECSDDSATTTTTTGTTITVTTTTAMPATVTTTTTTHSDSDGDGGCIGDPCSTQSHCRSKWGWCGTTTNHCNSESLWCGSEAATCECNGNKRARRLRGQESQ